jgi:phosphatidylserine/phosphatidylglycerophosphate/cardiolipin synthase-like enzyme
MKMISMKKVLLSLVFILSLQLSYGSTNVFGYLEKLFGKRLVSPPPTKIAAKGDITVAFSPNNGVTSTVVSQINKSKSLILVSASSFSSKEIAQALVAAKNKGVSVKIILDKGQYTHSYSSSKFFANQGFPSPYAYDDWQEWASAVVGVMNGGT